jgi:hypothetical protein
MQYDSLGTLARTGDSIPRSAQTPATEFASGVDELVAACNSAAGTR